MAAVVVVAHDEAILLLLERAVRLFLDEVIPVARAMGDALVTAVLDNGVARGGTEHGQVVVIGLIRRAARNPLVVVVPIHVDGQNELAHAALAGRAAGALLAPRQGRQQQGRENR